MFYNKKGLAYARLATILLILIGSFFLIKISIDLVSGGKKGAEIAACQSWVVTQSAIKDIQIMEISNPCVTFQSKLKGNRDEVYDILARSMHDTWKMYGQGKIDFFSEWDFGEKKTHCLIGVEITIDKKKLEVDNINIDEFEEFLSNNYPPNSEETYAVYFTGAKNTKIETITSTNEIDLKNNKKIYSIFTLKKAGIDTETKYGKIKGRAFLAVGCAVGVKYGGPIGAVFGFGIPGGIAGGAIGCAAGIIVTTGIRIAGSAEKVYPGILIVPGENIPSLEKECIVHYNPT